MRQWKQLVSKNGGKTLLYGMMLSMIPIQTCILRRASAELSADTVHGMESFVLPVDEDHYYLHCYASIVLYHKQRSKSPLNKKDKMNTRFLTSLLLVVAVSAVAVLGFQQQPRLAAKPSSSTTAVHGIFDSIKKGMESGYAGGDDSPYAKIKEADAKKEATRNQRAAERRKRGYTELKDVKEKSFVKLKYNQKEEEPPKEEKKKLFGLF